jgi:hypothetical protein
MANLRQIPSALRGHDSAGFAAKEIKESLSLTESSPASVETPLKKLLAFLRA